MEVDAKKVLSILDKTYPNAGSELKFKNPFELLVAVMLSAQSTDKTVNKVTQKLFEQYKTPYDFLNITQDKLEQEIKIIGIYRNKAKNILSACREIVEKFGGQVPNRMEDLMSLPGVGRKTADVVLSNAFGIPAIAVDTHVFRVSNRIGLSDSKNVLDTEKQLMKAIPKDMWSKAHHLLIWHGRRICSARKPKCDICPVAEYCNFRKGKDT